MTTQPNTASSVASAERSKSSLNPMVSSMSSAGTTSVGLNPREKDSSKEMSSSISPIGSLSQHQHSSESSMVQNPKPTYRFSEVRNEAWGRTKQYLEDSNQYIRKNPFYFIGGAALMGYALGAFLARSKTK
jgi:ElaB/YqjD/DUF883 family membrane-anchored ribosome-binding protein